jgi:8-oxo-dGTP diphosphatase
MSLPYKVATLLYCFNHRNEVLLMERTQEPNLGLWSPCGGKLHTDDGESPYACACREAQDELGVIIGIQELHLTGIVTEHGYEGRAHWLLFLFEVKRRLAEVPPVHREGRFEFFTPEALETLRIPKTDLESLWPLFWKHRGGFFAAHCRCLSESSNVWSVEESIVR